MALEALEPFNSAIYGVAAFFVSFFALSILWTLFLRFAESFFSKSRLYFIPRVLKELGLSIFLIFFLLSVYVAVLFYDPSIASGALVKIWGVLLIFVCAEVVVKLILGSFDYFSPRPKKNQSFISNVVPLLKRMAGVLLYSTALLVLISYLSYEVGTVVSAIGFLVVIFLFALYYDQLKNILAGIQIAGSPVNEGDFVNFMGRFGFVERILEQSTVLRDLDGRAVHIPNSAFLGNAVKDCCFSEGNVLLVSAVLKCSDASKAKERLSALSGKAVLASDASLKEYMPKVALSGVVDGAAEFSVRLFIKQNSDVSKLLDSLFVELKNEFGKDLVSAKLA